MANELLIYDVIGEDMFGEGVTAKAVREQLAELEGDIVVRINSPGGLVFEATAIRQQLREYKSRDRGGAVDMIIDGVAASAASFIATEGDQVLMAEGAMIMIHDPWGFVVGNRHDMRAEAALLDKMTETLANAYAAKSGRDAGKIAVDMEAETWLDADEAVDYGLADGLSDAKAKAFAISEKFGYRNGPKPHEPTPGAPHDLAASVHAGRLRLAKLRANVKI